MCVCVCLSFSLCVFVSLSLSLSLSVCVCLCVCVLGYLSQASKNLMKNIQEFKIIFVVLLSENWKV